jgi:hypothetical protein
MANQPTDEDIIQDAYAERLKAIFNNYVDVAPSDPDGAKAKFVEGVSFLQNLRATALQSLPKTASASNTLAMRASGAKKAAKKKGKA